LRNWLIFIKALKLKIEVETSGTPNEHASLNDSSHKAGNATLNAQENGNSK